MKKHMAWMVAALVGGCAADDVQPTRRTNADRPGLEDSSKAYKGKPSAAESAFWGAVRDGDDAAREAAVKDLAADVKRDPSNGYSAFLAGASPYFAPSNDALVAITTGGAAPPPLIDVDDKSAALLDEAVRTLKDPLYLGFAALFLGSARRISDPAEADRLLALSAKNNVPANRIGRLTFALVQSDPKTALDLFYDVMDHCLDRKADRSEPPVEEFVAKANQGALAHRECYSGYFAPHGTEGALFVGAELVAVNGNAALAKKFYQAASESRSYETWKLRAVNERRLAGEPAKVENMVAVVQCGTCHTK